MDNTTNTKIEELLEQFFAEYPCGDSFELSRFMYNHGWADRDASRGETR